MLDRKIFFDLSKITNCEVGGKNIEDEDKNPQIVLGSVGIQMHHAAFKTTAAGTTICPLSKESCPFVFVNGVPCKDMTAIMLKPNDRVIFGTGSCFLFKNGDKSDGSEVADTP